AGGAPVRGPARGIAQGVEAALLEREGQPFRVEPANAVDNARLVAMSLEDLDHLLLFIHLGQDAVVEVGPVKVADENLRLFQAELLDDVAADALGGRGRVGVHRGVGESILDAVELARVVTESVPNEAEAFGVDEAE